MKHFFFVCLTFFTLSTLALGAEPMLPAAFFATTLNDSAQKPIALERYRGKPLVINFWARWCPPCREEIPELVKFANTYKGKIEVLGIGIEDQAGPVAKFAAANKISYPLFIAGEQGITMMQMLGNKVGGLPFSLFVDRHGRVIETRLGMIKPADLDAVAPRLLKN